MPPKLSRGTSQGSQNSPDSEGLGAAVNQLCIYLNKGKSKKGQGKTPAVVNRIEGILKSYWKKSQKVNHGVLKGLVATMDDGGGADFCSQLDPSVFCIVLDTVIQADVCEETQRGLYYLSASLHQDSIDKEMEESIKPRKALIGKRCLGRLFEYFSDVEIDECSLMRRWVGILSIELVRASEENIEVASTFSDDARRGIARIMLSHPDEHIQIIAGELVKALIEGGMELEEIWPRGEANRYEGFPLTSSSRSGWVKTFSQWLVSVYAKCPDLTPQWTGEVIYVQSIELDPEVGFGAPGHMAVIYMEEHIMSILTPTNDGNMIQLLDTSLSCFKSIQAVSDESSQLQEVQLTLELDTDSPTKTYLDAIPIPLESITVVVDMALVDLLLQAIKEYSPDVAFLRPIQEYGLNLPDSEAQRSTHVSSSELMVRRGSADLPPTNDSDELDLLDSDGQQSTQVVSMAMVVRQASTGLLVGFDPKERIQELAEGEQSSSHESLNHSEPVQELPPYEEDDGGGLEEVIPSRSSGSKVEFAMITNQSERVATHPEPRRRQNIVRPTAKAPIGQATSKETKREMEPDIADPPLQSNDKAMQPSNHSRVVNENESPVELIEIREKSKKGNPAKSQKSKPKVVAKRPLNKRAPVLKPAPNEQKVRKNRIKGAPISKRVFDMGEDEDITSPDPPISKSLRRDIKTQKLRDAQIQTTTPTGKKRYNLNGVKKKPRAELVDVDPYDIPEDYVDDKKKKTGKKTPKAQTNLSPKDVASTGKVPKNQNTRVPAKSKSTRQSAPAALNGSVAPVRESQRAAAAKAKKKIRNLDDSDVEFEKRIDASVTPKSSPKPKLKDAISKKGAQTTAKTTAVLANGASAPILSKEKNGEKDGNVQAKNAIQPQEVAHVKEVTDAKGSSKNKEVATNGGLAISDASQPAVDLEKFHPDDAGVSGLVPQQSTPRTIDDDVDINNEVELVSKFPNTGVADKKPNKSIKKAKSGQVERFADRLEVLLGRISDTGDEFDTKGVETTRSTDNIPREESLLAEESLPTTSPFLPSSNLIEQTSPKIVLEQEMPKEQTKRSFNTQFSREARLIGEAATVEATVGAEENDFPPASLPNPEERPKPAVLQDPENYTKGMAEAVPTHGFRKPDIPIKSAALVVESKEETVYERSRRKATAEPKSGKIEFENRTFQSATEINMSEDVGRLVSGDTSQNDDNPEERSQAVARAQRKRKATLDISPESKRRRTEAETNSKANQTSHTPTSKIKLKLPQGSPDLPRHPGTANEHGANMSAAKKDPAIRPNLILFNNRGAINQGHSNTKKMIKEKDSLGDVAERKRKRVNEANIDAATHSPPKKRQHSSPVQHEDIFDQPNGDYAAIDDHMMKKYSPVAPSQRHYSRSTRQSSQLSRVDENGSPIAAGKIDHMGKLKQRLGPNKYPKSPHDQQLDNTAGDSLGEDEQGMFAPRAQLSPKRKARPSPQDEEFTSRYVAHERISHEQYRGIQSQELVASEAGTGDPFLEPIEKPTPFMERLRPTEPEKAQPQVHLHAPLPSQQDRKASPLMPLQEHRGNRRPEIKINRRGSKPQHHEDPERTLVNSNRQYGRQRSPAGVTNGSSPESRSSSHSTRQSQEDEWNVAIRPHYTSVYDAIHRVVDEVIIRLSDEEDRLGLIVKQYDENGTAILEKLGQKREREKSAILQGLESRSKEMKTVYTKSRDYIQERSCELKENLIHGFEKEWKKRQDEIQKTMVGGVDSLKG